jgi:hypothetical protein
VRGTNLPHVARTPCDRLPAGHAEGDTSAHLSAALGATARPSLRGARGGGYERTPLGSTRATARHRSLHAPAPESGRAARALQILLRRVPWPRVRAQARRRGRPTPFAYPIPVPALVRKATGQGAWGWAQARATQSRPFPLLPRRVRAQGRVGRGRAGGQTTGRAREARGRLYGARRVGSDLILRDQHHLI